MNIFDKFISYLTPGHFEGIVLYLLSCLIVASIQIYFMKEWALGLKGINRLWEGPEILLYICFWMFPPMVFADVFLQLRASDSVWTVFAASLFFGLTGRFGLEWLLAVKTGASQVRTVEKTKETEKITTEQNDKPKTDEAAL